jgi:hypothetical protein
VSNIIYSNWALISLVFLCRIDLQDKVCRLTKDPREEARSEVERLRQRLTAEFLVLHTYPNALNLNGGGLPLVQKRQIQVPLTIWMMNQMNPIPILNVKSS